jgi:DNA-binding Xre family transcriptional regulator
MQNKKKSLEIFKKPLDKPKNMSIMEADMKASLTLTARKEAREMIKLYAKLRGVILEKYGRQEDFASALNVDKTTLNLKLNGKSDFTASEIKKSCELLGINPSEIEKYFFRE